MVVALALVAMATLVETVAIASCHRAAVPDAAFDVGDVFARDSRAPTRLRRHHLMKRSPPNRVTTADQMPNK